MRNAKEVEVLTSTESELAAELRVRGLSEKEITQKIIARRDLQKNGKIKPIESKTFITDVSGNIVIEKSNASEEDNEFVKDYQREHWSAIRESRSSNERRGSI